MEPTVCGGVNQKTQDSTARLLGCLRLPKTVTLCCISLILAPIVCASFVSLMSYRLRSAIRIRVPNPGYGRSWHNGTARHKCHAYLLTGYRSWSLRTSRIGSGRTRSVTKTSYRTSHCVRERQGLHAAFLCHYFRWRYTGSDGPRRGLPA